MTLMAPSCDGTAARQDARWKVGLPLSVGLLASSLAAAIFWTDHAITCDYDVAGLLMHLDQDGPVRGFLPIARILIAPAVAGFEWLASWFGPYRAIEVWRMAVCACAALTVWITFAGCYRLTRSRSAALVGVAVVMLSGSLIYLLRVLEDNLLGNVWLSLLVLRLTPGRSRAVPTVAFAHAGMLWGMALSFGLAASSWILFLWMAAWASGTTWRERTLRFATATFLGAGVFLLVVAWLTPVGTPPPMNPLSRVGEVQSYVDMLRATYPATTEVRYVLLGIYHSLLGLPADVSREWSHAWPSIAAGEFGGLPRHALAAAGCGLVMIAAIRSVGADTVRRRFAIACCVTLAGLTAANLTSIDGSFPERFDHVPILLAPLVALAWQSGENGVRACRRYAVALVVAVAGTSLTYTARLGPGAGLWQYNDMRGLAAIRQPDEAVLLLAPVGDVFDMDPLSQGMALWLGRQNTWLVARRDIPRGGCYALAPLRGVSEPARLREWFRRELGSRPSVLLNEEARRALEPALAEDGWTLARVGVSGLGYYRARRGNTNGGGGAAEAGQYPPPRPR